MKIFGWTIIRWHNLQQLHARRKELQDDIKAHQRAADALNEDIEALKVKCSRVNISKLENEAVATEERMHVFYKDAVNDLKRQLADAKGNIYICANCCKEVFGEELSGNALQIQSAARPTVLQGPLVPVAEGTAEQGLVIVQEPEDAGTIPPALGKLP